MSIFQYQTTENTISDRAIFSILQLNLGKNKSISLLTIGLREVADILKPKKNGILLPKS